MSERIVEGVRLSNPDKILYPEQGVTKADLADHYVAVAERMLSFFTEHPTDLGLWHEPRDANRRHSDERSSRPLAQCGFIARCAWSGKQARVRSSDLDRRVSEGR